MVQKKKDLDKFRELLVQKQQELLENVQHSESSGREVNEDPVDIADVASSAYSKEFHFNKSNADRNTLRLINDAILRLDRGRYGRCQACGVLIEEKRLEVVPWARYCVGCQNKKEKGQLRD